MYQGEVTLDMHHSRSDESLEDEKNPEQLGLSLIEYSDTFLQKTYDIYTINFLAFLGY